MYRFLLMCVIFIMVSIAYFNLQSQINVTTDITNATKQNQVNTIKTILYWAMLLCAGLVIWSGYDFFYTEGASKFLGAKGCGCGGPKIRTEMSGMKEAMAVVQPFTGMYDLNEF